MGSETSTGSTQQLHKIVGAPTPQQLRFYIYNLELGIIRNKRRCSSLLRCSPQRTDGLADPSQKPSNTESNMKKTSSRHT